MVQDDIGSASPEPQATAQPVQAAQRVKTEIEFPYADLPAAVDLAQRIHTNAGSSCDDEEIAAWLDMSVHGGTFRSRRSSAGMFGLIEASGRRLTLTQLGLRINDDSDRAARVEAFLKPELFARMYEQWRGQALPPPAAIERQMGELGVPPKQKTRARQVFQKSAQFAGFIDASSGRFVRPSGGAPERHAPSPDRVDGGGGKAGGEGGGGGDEPPRHPLIEGLFQSLPPDGDPMTTEEAADWLQAAAYNLRFAYKFSGRIKVAIEDQGSSPIPIRNSGSDAA
jgi:hypothetical protein